MIKGARATKALQNWSELQERLVATTEEEDEESDGDSGVCVVRELRPVWD
jgi:hypothetical protein